RVDALAAAIRAPGVRLPIGELRVQVFARLLDGSLAGYDDRQVALTLAADYHAAADPDPVDDASPAEKPRDPDDGDPDDTGPDDDGPDDSAPNDDGPATTAPATAAPTTAAPTTAAPATAAPTTAAPRTVAPVVAPLRCPAAPTSSRTPPRSWGRISPGSSTRGCPNRPMFRTRSRVRILARDAAVTAPPSCGCA